METHKKKTLNTADFQFFPRVLWLCVAARTSTSHLERGSLATWPTRSRPSSRTTPVTLLARSFVPRCFRVYELYEYVFEAARWKNLTNSGAVGFAVDPFTY